MTKLVVHFEKVFWSEMFAFEDVLLLEKEKEIEELGCELSLNVEVVFYYFMSYTFLPNHHLFYLYFGQH